MRLNRQSRRVAPTALILFLSCLQRSCSADKIDDYVHAEMQKQHIAGLSLAIVRDGKATKIKGYGIANLEWKTPVTKDTAFQSGSVGKQFTSAAVMLLVEDGKIGLDEKISRYLPNTPEAWKEITVRHLLTHTSGLTDYQNDIDFSKDTTDAQMQTQFAKYPLDFATGSNWSYSNLGYVLLGILIKQVTGKFYGDVLKERVFTPLGMNSTRVNNDSDVISNRASGYIWDKDAWHNQGFVAQTWNQTADGSLLFTAADMAKWATALEAHTLFKPSTEEVLRTPVRLNNGAAYNYSMGWAISDVRGHSVIEHGGAWLGYRANISRYVDDKLTVVVLTNEGTANPEAITHGIAERILPNLALTGTPPVTDPDPTRTQKLLAALKDFAAATPNAPNMARGLQQSPSGTARDKGRRASLKQLVDKSKSFSYFQTDAVKERTVSKRGESVAQIVYCRLIDANDRPRTVAFYLTAEGLVADIQTL